MPLDSYNDYVDPDLKPLFEVDPYGKGSLNLHPGQRRAWDSQARVVAVLAGHQSGKTEFGPHWLAREILTRGPGDYYAVTATYDLFKLKMLPALTRLFSPKIGWQFLAGDQILEHAASRTRIILRSAMSTGGLEAGTGRAAWLDEAGQDAFVREAWDAIQRRLSIHRGRILITTTLYNFGWLKTEVYDRAEAGDPMYDVIQFKSTENPAYPPEEYARQKASLPAWKFEMTCNGSFSRPAGLIFSDYIDSYTPQLPNGLVDPHPDPAPDPAPALAPLGHLVHAFTPPHTFPRIVGIDFGGTEHTALIWLAEDTQNSIYYVYREAIGGGMSGLEHAKAALAYTRPNPITGTPQESVRLWTGGSRGENDARLEWNLSGIPVVIPFITDVEAGIDQIISLFKQRRLFVMDNLGRLRAELRSYSRELDEAGSPTTKIDSKSKFHALDGLRAGASGTPVGAPSSPAIQDQPLPRTRATFADALDDVEDGKASIAPIADAMRLADSRSSSSRWTLPRWRG